MIRCCALYYIDAYSLVTDHDSVLTFVKVLLTFAVDETKIALRIDFESEGLAFTCLDELLLEESELLHRTCDLAVRVIYIPVYSLHSVSVTDILHCNFCIQLTVWRNLVG